MPKNQDRDIVILNSPSKDGKDKLGSKERDFSDNRNKNIRDTRASDRGRNDRNSSRDHRSGGDHRDRSSHDHRNGGNTHRSSGNGGSGGGSGDTRQLRASGASSIGTKFSGMAFTENELLSDIPKKKFTGRCRLFIGNIPNEVKESELKELFVPYGDISECYVSGKGFAFLRLDTRAHAESAKEALDGKVIHGRQVRVRFAVHGATIKVKELAPVVSNEMLHLTFSAFGEVERAVHIVDEKGKPTGEGIIEFERKPSAIDALNQIKERVFLMTANSRPLVAEMLEPRDEEDGLAEKMLQRTPQLLKERELGPRFASVNSFEHVYGQKWKELYEMEKKRHAELKTELAEARKRLDADMEIAYEDYKTQLLREDLMRRQQELERLEAAKRERMQRGMGGMGGNGPLSGIFGGPIGGHSNDTTLMDGPLGRGAVPPPMSTGPRGLFFGANGPPPPMNPPPLGPNTLRGNGPAPPLLNTQPGLRNVQQPQGLNFPSSASPKLHDVQKLLQTFKNNEMPRNDMMRGGPGPSLGDRQHSGGGSGLPAHLLNIMGPFANALTGHGGSRPSDSFQPPEKRLRR